ncbi:hypothetical protein FE257_012540 [Aspergillus nanangensis]|uniref:CFEM domain-containing protein n=1 Tax=Aspergillus nanangensis TaxID=2582783 RepID=A0AAD4GWT9_ASPNN|nr:hypothetical protein FE257_012540 [Aspergillus nanangensis]
MKATTPITLLSLVALAQAHVPGLWWGTDTCYTSPDNTDNECTEDQHHGFDWSDLPNGHFSDYCGFDFSGFSKKDKGDSGSCVEGKLSSGLKFSRGQGFSVRNFRLSTSKETNVKVHYGMADGTTCKSVVSCSPEGTDVSNDQCGGATSVSFEHDEDDDEDCDLGIHKIDFDCSPGDKPPTTPSVPVGTPSETGVSPTSTSSVPVIPPPASSGTVTMTTPVPTTPVQMTTSTVYTTSEVTITSCAPTVTNCPADSTTVVTSTIAVSTTVCPVTSTETPGEGTSTDTPPVPTGSSPADTTSTDITPAPTGSSPVGSSSPGGPVPTTAPVSSPGVPTGVSPSSPAGEESTTTVVTYETVTTCPVTTVATTDGTTTTSVYSTVSTVTLTSTATVCNKCTATPPAPTGVAPITTPAAPATTTVVTYETVTTCPVTKTVSASGTQVTSVYSTVSTVTLTSTSVIHPTSTPEPSVPSAPCPNVVPKCINTWLNIPKCHSNADASCFCPSSDFTDKVIACIQSWGASEEEIQASLSYFTGICAPYVPENPGIVTAVPTTITLVPTVVPHPAPSATGVDAITAAPSVPCTTITYSTYTVTVPQVSFATPTGSSVTTIGLVPAPTGVSPTGTAIPNPWVSSASAWVTRTTNAPSSSPTILLSNSGVKESVSGLWWAMGIAAVMALVY